MTNRDKFLKAGVSIEEFIQKLTNHINKTQKSTYEKIKEFLEQPAQILTEDERVILRNINSEYFRIGRGACGDIYFVTMIDKMNEGKYETEFLKDDLFQFIKERRRIFNTRIVRR